MGMAVLALVLALNAFYIQADQVQPALQSYWLILHVGVAITATGIFTVAFAASVLQVLRSFREEALAVDAPAVSVGAAGPAPTGSAAGWADRGSAGSSRCRAPASSRRCPSG